MGATCRLEISAPTDSNSGNGNQFESIRNETISFAPSIRRSGRWPKKRPTLFDVGAELL